MERSAIALAVVLLIVGLGIGVGVGRYTAPVKVKEVTKTVTVETRPLEGKTIQFGDIVAQTSDLETYKPILDNVILHDINEYAKLLGYDVKFEGLLDDAQAQAAIHLEKVQSFKAMGVNLLICGRWSSQAQAALSYVNENDMIMFSPASTSPLLWIEGDRLFRMCPSDRIQAPAIAKMLWTWGIKGVIVIQRGDPWADGIYNIFEKEFPKLGGEILARVRYAAEVTEFSSYLEQMEEVAKEAVEKYGAEHVGILPISFSEIVTILTQAKDYPTIYNLMWFGTDGTAFVAQLVDDAPEHADHCKVLSTLAAPAESPKWDYLMEKSYEVRNMPADYYTACAYDIYHAYVHIILEEQTDEPSEIADHIIPYCYDLFGTSGWCQLDKCGDRAAANYDIWGYAIVDGKCTYVKYGVYSSVTGEVKWLEKGVTTEGVEVPGLTPPGQG